MRWLQKVGTTPLTAVAKVIDSLTTQTNDRTNAPSIRAVRDAIESSSLEIYPVGSIYMSVNDVNPATIFGGTWQKIEDKFLLASGTTYTAGATGGSATHTPSGTVGNHALTTDEMPGHTHTYTRADSAAGHQLTFDEMPMHTHTFSNTNYWRTTGVNDATLFVARDMMSEGRYFAKNSASYQETAYSGGNQAHSHDISSSAQNTGSRGLGNAHNHSFTGTEQNTMPPYLVVNVYVRTA